MYRKSRDRGLQRFWNWCRPKAHCKVSFSSSRGPRRQVFVCGVEVNDTFQCSPKAYVNSETALAPQRTRTRSTPAARSRSPDREFCLFGSAGSSQPMGLPPSGGGKVQTSGPSISEGRLNCCVKNWLGPILQPCPRRSLFGRVTCNPGSRIGCGSTTVPNSLMIEDSSLKKSLTAVHVACNDSSRIGCGLTTVSKTNRLLVPFNASRRKLKPRRRSSQNQPTYLRRKRCNKPVEVQRLSRKCVRCGGPCACFWPLV